MWGLNRRDAWKILAYTLLGILIQVSSVVIISWVSGLFMRPSAQLGPTSKTIMNWLEGRGLPFGYSVVLVVGLESSWLPLTGFVLSALTILLCGPKENRIAVWKILLLSIGVSIVLSVGVLLIPVDIYVSKSVLQRGHIAVAFTTGAIWCLTWALDVVRRSKA